ncbi:class I SAM-dependent methyltransferase [Thauera sinica]|uniref:Class I SAM-dependent methyltransferase n=1 Tax=Thauera sinica TaxID=2665146 RepID=A0ABW1APK6_9RHOO|nr:class I SAM-dependent methyltransferase [Thauera sp. K11]ATE62488.1 methyltransferase [Thauera sp. K11]
MRLFTPSLLSLAAAALLSLQPAGPARADDAGLRQWIDGAQRSERNRARDPARKPAETLAFFGLQPDQTVVEVWPSVGAWWFEILAPYLRDRGRYVAALHAGAHNPPAAKAEHDAIEGRIANRPELYGKVEIAHTPGLPDTVKPDSVDLLLTFQNLHNWITDGNADEHLREFHTVLKPGGVLGIVDHRARTDRPADEQSKAGYLREDEVVALFERHGFKLAGRSEIAANPRDTKDHPQGVWTLPPTLRLKDVDRERYLAIGESDKFTLKFVKIARP